MRSEHFNQDDAVIGDALIEETSLYCIAARQIPPAAVSRLYGGAWESPAIPVNSSNDWPSLTILTTSYLTSNLVYSPSHESVHNKAAAHVLKAFAFNFLAWTAANMEQVYGVLSESVQGHSLAGHGLNSAASLKIFEKDMAVTKIQGAQI